MPFATLKNIVDEFGISLEDKVYYYVREKKGVIEIELDATDQDIEQAAVHDSEDDYLTKEELDYYLNLDKP